MTGAGPVVVKLGGTTIAEEQGVLAEIAAISRERPVVVVHGGGRRLSDWLDRLGVEHRFHEGLRVTDDTALEVAMAVLRGVVNTELVAALCALDRPAVGLSGVDGRMLTGERQGALGRVMAEPVADPAILELVLETGYLPVVAPLGLDGSGAICNVNADDAAAALAVGLRGTLVLLTDTDGIRGADGRRIDSITGPEAEGLIEQGVIGGGMVPKVRAATRGLWGPDAVAVIADGRPPGILERVVMGSAVGTKIGY